MSQDFALCSQDDKGTSGKRCVTFLSEVELSL